MKMMNTLIGLRYTTTQPKPSIWVGYFLSDEKINLQKWQFPSVHRTRLRLFTRNSQRQRQGQPKPGLGNPHRLGQRLEISCACLQISAHPGVPLGLMIQPGLSGPSGFGYGDGDDSTLLSQPLISVLYPQNI
jgi:hypothetical protein